MLGIHVMLHRPRRAATTHMAEEATSTSSSYTYLARTGAPASEERLRPGWPAWQERAGPGEPADNLVLDQISIPRTASEAAWTAWPASVAVRLHHRQLRPRRLLGALGLETDLRAGVPSVVALQKTSLMRFRCNCIPYVRPECSTSPAQESLRQRWWWATAEGGYPKVIGGREKRRASGGKGGGSARLGLHDDIICVIASIIVAGCRAQRSQAGQPSSI